MADHEMIKIDQLVIEEIIFDDSYDVTIFCEALMDQEKNFITLGLNFDDLNFLLMQSGKDGLKVAEAIGEEIGRMDSKPRVIEVEDVIGAPLEIDTCIIEVYSAEEMDDEDGDWYEGDDNVYIVDNIIPKSKQELEATNNRKKFQEHLDLLKVAFQYYQKLIDTGISENEARKKAGLAEELLFKLAYYYNKIN